MGSSGKEKQPKSESGMKNLQIGDLVTVSRSSNLYQVENINYENEIINGKCRIAGDIVGIQFCDVKDVFHKSAGSVE